MTSDVFKDSQANWQAEDKWQAIIYEFSIKLAVLQWQAQTLKQAGGWNYINTPRQ